MKILEKIENPLLSRIRIKAEVEHLKKPTPSIKEITKQLAHALETKEELIQVEHIYTNFGPGISKIIAYAYKDEKALKSSKINKKKKVKKEEKTEEPKKE